MALFKAGRLSLKVTYIGVRLLTLELLAMVVITRYSNDVVLFT